MGHTVSTGHRNVSVRIAQYRAAFDERRSLVLARGLVAAKIKNARVFLRRNFKSREWSRSESAGHNSAERHVIRNTRGTV